MKQKSRSTRSMKSRFPVTTARYILQQTFPGKPYIGCQYGVYIYKAVVAGNNNGCAVFDTGSFDSFHNLANGHVGRGYCFADFRALPAFLMGKMVYTQQVYGGQVGFIIPYQVRSHAGNVLVKYQNIAAQVVGGEFASFLFLILPLGLWEWSAAA
jgi:hypothetical protein